MLLQGSLYLDKTEVKLGRPVLTSVPIKSLNNKELKEFWKNIQMQSSK